MLIGIDVQGLGGGPAYRQTGVSRYIERLLAELPAALDEDDVLRLIRSEGDLPGPLAPVSRRWQAAMTRPLVRAIWQQSGLPLRAVREGLDVLHCPVNVVPLGATCPTVITIHDLAYLRLPEVVPAARRTYFGTLTKLSARRATQIVTVSEATKTDVCELLEVAPERVDVTPLGVDSAFQPQAPEALAAFRQEVGLTRPYVLFVGTIEPRKNLVTLLQAFDRIAEEVEHDLVLVGPDGWLMGPIQDAWQQMRHQDRVRWQGFASTEHLPLWMGAADLFAFPSLYEGFGLPPLEAMACGTPVVTSNVSSLPEVVGEAAVTVDPLDVDALAEAMRAVLTDSTLADRLRTLGLARARQFSWSETAERTIAAYRKAAR